MKTTLILAMLLTSVSALAANNDSPCMTKQKNAASFELAQQLAVPVQSVEVLAYEFGPWTEAVGNNVGTDKVTVSAGNRDNRGITIKKYEVSGRQIGSSNDCVILGLEEVNL